MFSNSFHMTPKTHIKHAKHAFITRAVLRVQTFTPLLDSSDGSLDKSQMTFLESVYHTYLTVDAVHLLNYHKL